MRKKRPHGTGHIYKQTYRMADGTVRETKVWWLAFWHHGRLVRETARTATKTQAEKLLRRRMAAKDAGLYAGPDASRTTLTDLCRVLEDNYRANGRPTQDARQRFAHVEVRFGADRRAREITTDRIVAYQAERLAQGARPAVNRELAALRRAFRPAPTQRAAPDQPTHGCGDSRLIATIIGLDCHCSQPNVAGG